ncbi:porin family protein [Candidatus Cloacimonadota bacterium]
MNFKKIIITVLFMVLLTSLVHAQLFARSGFKGGVNFAKYTGSDVHDPETMIGYIIGGFVAFEINESFYIQPEVFYTMKGVKFSGPGWEYSENINYIEVPLLVKYVLSTYGNSNPYVLTGPAFGFNLGGTYDAESDDGDGSGDLDDIAPLDAGLVFAGGFDFGRIILEVRYTMGLSAIYDFDEDVDAKNAVLSIMAGFTL